MTRESGSISGALMGTQRKAISSELPLRVPVRSKKSGSSATLGTAMGRPGLHHPAGDPFAQPIAAPGHLLGAEAVSRHQLDPSGPGVEEAYGPPADAQETVQKGQGLAQGFLQVTGPGQDLGETVEAVQLFVGRYIHDNFVILQTKPGFQGQSETKNFVSGGAKKRSGGGFCLENWYKNVVK